MATCIYSSINLKTTKHSKQPPWNSILLIGSPRNTISLALANYSMEEEKQPVAFIQSNDELIISLTNSCDSAVIVEDFNIPQTD
ncbi:predicted protein [Sclerotinia sclerotiorum 1980 UF-70]|uniref:Uncharacterized protein n=1 Tax=Sclerotinia sclerotiorum (strain ATCC 18683 / 1980 / Ss-1) TaxID=665079 RepID=A7EHZ0_SCLS1|nr:predicted protein [Sclerotinia sclerotiorum 1980 UF-70]EDO02456.1 predicted protein [Sclerotinia sclerotiorum 1980 UF-70]